MGNTGELRCYVFCVACLCALFSYLQPAAQAATWATETVVSSGMVGTYTSIALDSSGDAHISYYDDTNDDLRYGRVVTTSGADGDSSDGEDFADQTMWFTCFIVTAMHAFD